MEQQPAIYGPLIAIIGTLIGIMLAWLCNSQQKLGRKIDNMVSEKDLECCRAGCHEEQRSMWKRINKHGHDEKGNVTITGDE